MVENTIAPPPPTPLWLQTLDSNLILAARARALDRRRVANSVRDLVQASSSWGLVDFVRGRWKRRQPTDFDSHTRTKAGTDS